MILSPVRTAPILLVSLALPACASRFAAPQYQGDPGPPPGYYEQHPHPDEWHDDPHEHDVAHKATWYLPNRFFDIFDMVRARVRLGPGLAVSARVTEIADVTVGGYTTVFIGIHGPRGYRKIPWPVGYERLAGVEISAADTTHEQEPNGPTYGPLEIGLGFQALIVGADVGIEPFEMVDFVIGFLFFDPARDDL